MHGKEKVLRLILVRFGFRFIKFICSD